MAILSVALTCQFLRDSLKNDFRGGGNLFLLNAGCGFLSPFLSKCGVAVVVGIVPCLLAFVLALLGVIAASLPLCHLAWTSRRFRGSL